MKIFRDLKGLMREADWGGLWPLCEILLHARMVEWSVELDQSDVVILIEIW